jgi:hypothetical protein
VGFEPCDTVDTISRKFLFRECESASYYLYAMASFRSSRTGAEVVWSGVVIGICKIFVHGFLWGGDVRLRARCWFISVSFGSDYYFVRCLYVACVEVVIPVIRA